MGQPTTEDAMTTGDAGTAEAADLSGAGTADTAETPLGVPFEDLRAYQALPRIQSLALSPDGTRLVAGIARLNPERNAFVTSLWAIDPAGERPARRLTRALEGESLSAFLPDGSLLFTSARALPQDGAESTETTKALWCLPAEGGEAFPVARRDGGWSSVATARASSVAVFGAPAHAGTDSEEADARKRKERKDKKVAALLHSGFPVRYWDHDLGPEWPRLLVAALPSSGDAAELAADGFRDLAGDVSRRLTGTLSLSDDGSVLVSGWREYGSHGRNGHSVVCFDTATGKRRTLAEGDMERRHAFWSPIVSGDGGTVACVHVTHPDHAEHMRHSLHLIDVATGAGRDLAADWDREGQPVAFSPDGRTLYVTADEDGDSPLFAVGIESGQVTRLTGPGAFGPALLSPDGGTLYALRTAYDCPGEVVAIDTASHALRVLDAGIDPVELPGTLERVETTLGDGTRIPGYLCLPAGSGPERPAPLALWVHGGPMGSWNSWSWRWCPWLLVSQGYAVLLPDPALSTGYGWEYSNRGWLHWGDVVYGDVMALTDAIEARPEIDATRTCMMGGSFGGYMANWIAGSTDRFQAIVSHASLWDLRAFGATTDGADFWDIEVPPRMAAEQSPHDLAGRITTPMLVVHGDKDYRVPIGEGLALWWRLNQHWDGAPEDLPHRFLYFPDENHWVLSPQHATLWYETVRAFLAWHVLGREWVAPELL